MTDDERSRQIARQAAQAITVAVRLLRVPTLLLWLFPLPAIALVWFIGFRGEGVGSYIALALAFGLTAVSAAFGWRRYRILRAVDDLEPLVSEITIAMDLSDHAGDIRTALTQAAGTQGGWRLFNRLQGAWRVSRTPDRWIRSVSDLPRARYFFPPRLATTVKLTILAALLIPASAIGAFLLGVGALAGTI